MNIVHIGTADNSGGAARASYRLHLGLQAAGHASKMVVGWSVEPSQSVHAVMTGSTRKKIVRRLIALGDAALSAQYLLLPWGRDFLSHPFVTSADIIHLHNLHTDFFPLWILPKLSRIAPLVWSLHDMWSMTGHCSYSYDCERWKTGCGRCPLPGEYPAIYLDTTAIHWRLKNWLYRHSRVSVVTGSAWMAGLARQSPLLARFPIATIPYSTDLSVFRPADKAHARMMLRIPPDAQVVLVYSVSGKRKGTAFLLDALQNLTKEPRPWLLVIGDKLREHPAGFPVRETGYINSDDLLNTCYAAADMMVLPTLAENLPLSVLDGLAAGIPAVANDVGGVSEIVHHLRTGLLVPPNNVTALTEGIDYLLARPDVGLELGRNARALAQREHSLEMYAARHIALYEQFLGRRGGHQATPGAE